MAHDHLEQEQSPQRGQGRGGPLPLAARQALWRQIWQRLLMPPDDEEPANAGSAPEAPADGTTVEVTDDAA